MSFETIEIYRSMPLKNNYVQVPTSRPVPGNVFITNAVTAANPLAVPQIPALYGSEIITLGINGSDNYLYGAQRLYRFGGINARAWYTNGDPTAALAQLPS